MAICSQCGNTLLRQTTWICLACGGPGDTEVVKALRKEVKQLRKKLESETAVTAGYASSFDDRTEWLEEITKAFRECLGWAEDMMSYCIDEWDWKYGDYWREEQAKARAALEDF